MISNRNRMYRDGSRLDSAIISAYVRTSCRIGSLLEDDHITIDLDDKHGVIFESRLDDVGHEYYIDITCSWAPGKLSVPFAGDDDIDCVTICELIRYFITSMPNGGIYCDKFIASSFSIETDIRNRIIGKANYANYSDCEEE